MKLLDAALVAESSHGADVFGGDFKQWCLINKVPRSTAYRHRQRVAEEGCWTPRSTRPKKRAGWATPWQVEVEIVRLRTELTDQPGADNGADSIRYWLQQLADLEDWAGRGWMVPSRATINKIMKRYGLVRPEPKKKPKSSYRRFAYARPRDCYQIDATEVVLAGGATAVVFEVLDDCSRVLVATLAWHAENAAGAIAAITRAFTGYGVPAVVPSDNGTAFTSRRTRGGTSKFTRTVTVAGARLIHSSPYHPQTCGKVERHHRTFKAWLAAQPAPATLAELQTLCDRYQDFYNTSRRHSAWNQPPQQVWDHAVPGGPSQLPIQTDADVRVRTMTDTGTLRVATAAKVTVGRRYPGQHITVLSDGDHATLYQADGRPIGHLHLDHTRPFQQLRPAA
jgi:putative transposase